MDKKLSSQSCSVNNEPMRDLLIAILLAPIAAAALACQVYTEDLLLPAAAAAGGGGAATGGWPPRTLWATSFEDGESAFELTAGAGELVTEPPAGITPRTGDAALSTSIITPDFADLTIISECLPINVTDEVTAAAWGTADPDNGANVIWARVALLWYGDAACTQTATSSCSSPASRHRRRRLTG
jgi:hypothetical protein